MFIDRCYEKEKCMGDMNTINNCPCIMECPQERVCHIETVHNVPQECPFM